MKGTEGVEKKEKTIEYREVLRGTRCSRTRRGFPDAASTNRTH